MLSHWPTLLLGAALLLIIIAYLRAEVRALAARRDRREWAETVGRSLRARYPTHPNERARHLIHRVCDSLIPVLVRYPRAQVFLYSGNGAKQPGTSCPFARPGENSDDGVTVLALTLGELDLLYEVIAGDDFDKIRAATNLGQLALTVRASLDSRGLDAEEERDRLWQVANQACLYLESMLPSRSVKLIDEGRPLAECVGVVQVVPEPGPWVERLGATVHRVYSLHITEGTDASEPERPALVGIQPESPWVDPAADNRIRRWIVVGPRELVALTRSPTSRSPLVTALVISGIVVLSFICWLLLRQDA